MEDSEENIQVDSWAERVKQRQFSYDLETETGFMFVLNMRSIMAHSIPTEFVSELAGRYWNNVKREATQICQSLVQAQQREKEEADTVTALASLSMGVVKETEK